MAKEVQAAEQMDLDERPLSPVLTSNTSNRKCYINKRKSRVKLSDRFSKTNKSMESDQKEAQDSALLGINDDNLTPSQTKCILESLEIMEQIEEEQWVPQKNTNIVNDFNFKVPISPAPHIKKTNVLNSNQFSGFQTAAGKSITLSEEMMKKSTDLFNDILNPSDHLENSRSNKYSFLSKTKQQICDSKNDDVDLKRKFTEELPKESFQNVNPFTGFKKASGKEIQIKESDLNIARKIFGEDFKNPELLFNVGSNAGHSKGPNPHFFEVIKVPLLTRNDDFKGFDKDVIEDSKRKANEFVMYVEKLNHKKVTNLKSTPNHSSFDGFTSASGNAISISKSSLKKAEQIFKGINVNLVVGTINNESKPKTGFQTASGKSFHVSEDALKTAEQLFNNISIDQLSDVSETSQNVTLENSFDSETSRNVSKTLPTANSSGKLTRKKRLGVSSYKPIHISNEKLEKAKLVFDDEKLPLKPTVYNSTPVKTTFIPHLEEDLTPIKSTNSVILKDVTECSEKRSNGGILIQECTKGTIDSWYANLENEQKLLELKIKIISERKEALSKQKALLGSSSDDHRKKRSGVLFTKKQNSERISLQNFLKPFVLLKDLPITPQNAEKVHFSCSNPYLATINTLDGACVIPNIKNLIGLSEIEMAFKVMPGIEPKFIPNGWVRNHFKWIVWKLASYERFAMNLNECLTVENIIQQLKYRYDREIDRAERSTLRKIFEKDDVPQKRMVLCVSNIINLSNNKCELELTDAWYSIRTSIDEPLKLQIIKKKIQIGTKLITCGAELLNCDGCHPLQGTDMVRLKINFNSTRRVIWYAKLGYQQFLEPFPLKLQSLTPAGGLIGCIKIFIARVYPLKYIEKQNSLNVWRNQKAEKLRAQNWENERLLKIEKIRENVRQECEQFFDKTTNVAINMNKNEIKNIRCPKTLYDLCQNSNDPESLQEILSPSQRNAVIEYRQNLSYRQQHEMSLKIKENIDKLQLNCRNVTPVLQLSVIDILDPKDKATVFHIWNPSETHLQQLKESSLFCVYNVLLKKNGDLSSVSKTKFKPISQETDLFSKYKRTLLPIAMTCDRISKPIFNEFDTVGIVIQISVNSFDQNLWLADPMERLLFIKVFQGPENCLLLENLKEGQLIAVSNLTLCESKHEFGEAVANNLTIISSYPKSVHLQEGISTLSKQIPKDLNAFLKRCIEKINYNINKVSIKRDHKSYASNSLVQLSNSELFDDSFEESTLTAISSIIDFD